MTDHEWHTKCGAAFLALYAALKLCHSVGIDHETMLAMLRDRLREDGCLLPDGRVIEKGTK